LTLDNKDKLHTIDCQPNYVSISRGCSILVATMLQQHLTM